MKITHQIIYTICACFAGLTTVNAQEIQRLSIDSVIARVAANPALQAYDAKISAQDAYAGGAKSHAAPQISAGQYQTPYQLNPDNGSFMISAEQTFTNPAKLQAKERYMKGLSKETEEDKNYAKNQLIAQAKQY